DQEPIPQLNSCQPVTQKWSHEMKTFVSILALSAGLAVFPAVADSLSPSDQPVVLTGGACVGPLCVGRDRGRDWDRHREGYGRDREHGCRTVTVEREDGSVKRIRRCD